MTKKAKKKTKKKTPSAYVTMPHYFPTEQVDIVRELKPKRRRKKKNEGSLRI